MSQFVSTYSLSLLSTRNPQEKVAYREYLQSQNFVKEITDSHAKVQYGVSTSSREIIATLEQLREAHFEVGEAVRDVADSVREVGDVMKQGFQVIAYQLEDIAEGVTELNATCNWGFSRMIADIGQVSDSLKELIAINKNPVQTRAYNKFEIARDALRRELYPEAVEAVEQAINGYGGETGYKLEYRFHYTLGLLHLGDVKNTDPAILDLAKAENDFLTTARYAKTDFPLEAGVAFTAASWAAYCQGRLAEAQNYAEQAIAIHPKHGEAFYQLAKILMFRDEPGKAIPHLLQAITLDRNYMLKAAADMDFLKYESQMNVALDKLRKATGQISGRPLGQAQEAIQVMLEWRIDDAVGKLKALQMIKAAKQEAQTDTYFGYLNACDLANKAKALAEDVTQRHRQSSADFFLREIKRLKSLAEEIRPVAEQFGSGKFQGTYVRLDSIDRFTSFFSNSQSDADSSFAELNDLEAAFRGEEKVSRSNIEIEESSAETAGRVEGTIKGGLFGLAIGFMIGIPVALVLGIVVAFASFGGNGTKAAVVTLLVFTIPGLFIGARSGGKDTAKEWREKKSRAIEKETRR